MNKFLPGIVVSLICLFIASPFVFNGSGLARGQSWGIRQAEAYYDFSGALDKAADKSGFKAYNKEPVELPVLIGLIIRIFIGLIGVIFLILTIISGLRWMWSAGEEQTISAAKKTIKNSIIGAIIALGAYAITYYVMKALF